MYLNAAQQRRDYLSSRHCAFAEGFGLQLPVVFVDHVAGFVCSDFLHAKSSRILTIRIAAKTMVNDMNNRVNRLLKMLRLRWGSK